MLVEEINMFVRETGEQVK